MFHKLNAVVLAVLFCAICLFAKNPVPNPADPAMLDDFNDTYEGDAPNQTNLGAVKGILEKGFAYKGGGWWYAYGDDSGGVVLNEKGDTVDGVHDNAGTMVDTVSNWLHVKVKTSPSIMMYPFAGFGCLLTGKDPGDYYDLSNLKNLKMRIKGSGTGSVHIRIETKDIKDAGYTWGEYEYAHKLKADWEDLTIPVASLLPPPFSEPAKAKWTWDHGKTAANRVSFQVKDGDDADVYIDDILLDGMIYGKFVPIVHNAVVKRNSPVLISGNTISYTLLEAQPVKLAIYDVKGKLVNELVNAREVAGKHSVKWNGENSAGSKLGNGVYVCRFNAGVQSLNVPLTIVK